MSIENHRLKKIEFCKFVGGNPFVCLSDGSIGARDGEIVGWTFYAPGHDPKGWMCETEEERQLKQAIKLTEQDVFHKQRMIENDSAKLEELRKKREGV